MDKLNLVYFHSARKLQSVATSGIYMALVLLQHARDHDPWKNGKTKATLFSVTQAVLPYSVLTCVARKETIGRVACNCCNLLGQAIAPRQPLTHVQITRAAVITCTPRTQGAQLQAHSIAREVLRGLFCA